jgi:hypothetical protein
MASADDLAQAFETPRYLRPRCQHYEGQKRAYANFFDILKVNDHDVAWYHVSRWR